MRRVPRHLSEALARAQTAIKVATRILKAARHREAEALAGLRAAGVSSADIAAVVAKAEGQPASVANRRRIGGRLRQRRWRVRHRNRDLRAPSPRAVRPPLPSTAREEVTPMPQIIRKVTKTETTDFLAEDADEVLFDEDEVEDEDGDEDDEPRRPKKQSRK